MKALLYHYLSYQVAYSRRVVSSSKFGATEVTYRELTHTRHTLVTYIKTDWMRTLEVCYQGVRTRWTGSATALLSWGQHIIHGAFPLINGYIQFEPEKSWGVFRKQWQWTPIDKYLWKNSTLRPLKLNWDCWGGITETELRLSWDCWYWTQIDEVGSLKLNWDSVGTADTELRLMRWDHWHWTI
jgi:hypothetical protein